MAGGADHLLLDTVRRRLRQPAGWLAVVLHLSRLAWPAPRPHHRRIARVLMEDTARRHDGLVFAPANGDMLLLCRAGEERRPGHAVRVASPGLLPEILGRLLRADLPVSEDLVSVWPLEVSGDKVLSYALDQVAADAAEPAAPADPRAQQGAADALAEVIGGPDIADVLRRQTAVLVAGDGVRPLFRELRFSMSALEARLSLPVRADADPYVLRHLTERLDQRLLSLVGLALGTGEAADPAHAGIPTHLNFTLGGLRSEGFAHFAERVTEAGVPLGVEISVVEACADPDRFESARAVLRRLGMTLVLDGITPASLRLARVEALDPDLAKLTWSPHLAEAAPDADAAARQLIEALGPDRVVLHHAETEAAMRWGVDRGLRRFQGRHVDAMLGALRLSGCPFARGCTLQQCIGRAAAADAAGRRDCRDHALLDQGAPHPEGARATAAAVRPMRPAALAL